MLKQTDPSGHYDFFCVYVFLDKNKIDHPNRFITPINNTIPPITTEAQNISTKSYTGTSSLRYLAIDIVCHVLDEQFKDSSIVFRPNILKLQEVLERFIPAEYDEADEYTIMWNSYRLGVKN